MAKYKFAVQAINKPYGPTESISWENAEIVSKHTTYSAANKAESKYYQDHFSHNNGSAWSGHTRIIALVDVPMTVKCDCSGWIDPCMDPCFNERVHLCDKFQTIHYVWKAGKLEQDPELPEGWEQWDLCSDCAKKQEEQENKLMDLV